MAQAVAQTCFQVRRDVCSGVERSGRPSGNIEIIILNYFFIYFLRLTEFTITEPRVN